MNINSPSQVRFNKDYMAKITAIIQKGKNEIATSWQDKILHEIPIYKTESKELIKTNIVKNINCLLDYIEGDIAPTDKLILEIAKMRSKTNIRVFDFTKALFLGRDTIHDYIINEHQNYDHKQSKKIEDWFFYTILFHAETHSSLLQSKLKKQPKNFDKKNTNDISNAEEMKKYLAELKKIF